MNTTVYIEDVLTDIIKKVSVKFGDDIQFIFGSFPELKEVLKKMTDVGLGTDKKYPLIWMVTDVEGDNGKQLNVYSEMNLRLIIFTVTDPTYLSPQRLEYSFKPILEPIHELLIDEIKLSKEINTDMSGLIPHKTSRKYQWGRDNKEEYPFSDFLDAIDIKNLNIKLKNKNCN